MKTSASVIILFALSSGGRATASAICLRYDLAVEDLNTPSQGASAFKSFAGASSFAYKKPDCFSTQPGSSQPLELVVASDAVTWGSPIPAADVEPTGFIGTSSGSAGLDDVHDCTADELVQE